MKILVTGASGFVGSHLCQKLEASGHQVYALLRDPNKIADLNLKAKILQGDLNSHSYLSFINEIPNDLDAVVHTAGIVHSFDAQEFYRSNQEATLRLFHALKDRRPKQKRQFKFIFLSSLAAMGPSTRGRVLTEKKWAKPISEYGRSKLLAETQLLELEVRFPQVELFIFRPPMIIGPRDTAVLDILKMVRDGIVLTGGPGGFQKEYSFISIFDLVNYISHVITHIHKGPKIYLPAHPEIATLDQIVTVSSELLNRKKVRRLKIPASLLSLTARVLEKANKLSSQTVRLTPDKLKEILAEAWICSGDKLARDTGIHCQYSLKEIMEITIKDYQARGWL